MTNLTISLPEALAAYLKEQLASGQYDTANDYIQALIQQDKARKDHLESLIIEGLNSGEPTPMTTSDWESIRAAVHQNQSDQSHNG